MRSSLASIHISEPKTDLDTKEISHKTLSKSVIIKILIIVELISLGVAGFIFYQYVQEKQKASSGLSANGDVQGYVNAVKKLILIDETQDPTVGTVKDINLLKKSNEEFYKNAKNGEVLLIYPKRAILYDPEANQIINVAPIIATPDSNATQPVATPTPTVVPTSTPTPTPKKK